MSHVKEIKRHAPSTIIAGLLALVVLGIGVATLFLPLFTVNYSAGTFSLTGLDLIRNALESLAGKPENANSIAFYAFFTKEPSLVEDIFLTIFVSLHKIFTLVFPIVLLFVLFFSALEVIYVVRLLLSGKAHFLKGPKNLNKVQFIFLGIFTVVGFVFYYFYQKVMKIYEPDASFSFITNVLLLLVASLGCLIVNSIIYSFCFKNAVFEKPMSKREIRKELDERKESEDRKD